MIQYAEIDGKKHPFVFGMREMYNISRSAEVTEFDETVRRVAIDFDAFLELFHSASKKGCRHHLKETGEEIAPLSEQAIEDAVDEDPELFTQLNEMFEKSMPVPEKVSEKKPKN